MTKEGNKISRLKRQIESAIENRNVKDHVAVRAEMAKHLEETERVKRAKIDESTRGGSPRPEPSSIKRSTPKLYG